jgi:hypothetical protein
VIALVGLTLIVLGVAILMAGVAGWLLHDDYPEPETLYWIGQDGKIIELTEKGMRQ